jgi:hypothetical protein
MKLVDIKILKEDTVYKKILEQLKLKGLDKIYVRRTETVDYLDIILIIIEFLENNKDIFSKLKKKDYEKLLVLILVEVLENINIEIEEEQLEKIIALLKSSLLVQNANNFLKNIFKKFCFLCGNSNEVIEPKTIEMEAFPNYLQKSHHSLGE